MIFMIFPLSGIDFDLFRSFQRANIRSKFISSNPFQSFYLIFLRIGHSFARNKLFFYFFRFSGDTMIYKNTPAMLTRSEERRVGKESIKRCSREQSNKNE